MNRDLLIVGAGCKGFVAKEIAEELQYFEKISFVDDALTALPDGTKVVGKVADIENLCTEYSNIIVALENSQERLSMIRKIKETTPLRIVSLVSRSAHISPSAQIMEGCIVEPMSVVNPGSVVSVGCFLSAGCVVGCGCMCCDGTAVGYNAVVAERTIVSNNMVIPDGVVYKSDASETFIKDLSIVVKE